MDDLLTLMNTIIHRSFPELLQETLSVEYESDLNCFLYYNYSKKEYHIGINEILRGYTVEVIGGLVHELCHIVRDRYTGWFDDFLYNHYQPFRIMDERTTDLCVILRGYGPELLAFERYAVKDDPDRKTDGLSLLELEILVPKQKI